MLNFAITLLQRDSTLSSNGNALVLFSFTFRFVWFWCGPEKKCRKKWTRNTKESDWIEKSQKMQKDSLDSQDNNNSFLGNNKPSLVRDHLPKTYKPYCYLNPFVYDYSLHAFDNPLEKYKVKKWNDFFYVVKFLRFSCTSLMPRRSSRFPSYVYSSIFFCWLLFHYCIFLFNS